MSLTSVIFLSIENKRGWESLHLLKIFFQFIFFGLVLVSAKDVSIIFQKKVASFQLYPYLYAYLQSIGFLFLHKI